MGPGASRRIALRKGHDEEEGERKRRLLVARAKADKGGEKVDMLREAKATTGGREREGGCGLCVCACVRVSDAVVSESERRLLLERGKRRLFLF